jgi:hypothetical protein
MFPMAAPCRLTTKDEGRAAPRHGHRGYPDSSGNGVTDVVASHFHYIRDWKVVPDLTDGHIHGLTSIPCGSGRL